MAAKKNGRNGVQPPPAGDAPVGISTVNAVLVPEPAAPGLIDEGTALSRKLSHAGQHGDQAIVHEVLVSLGALRARLVSVTPADADTVDFVAKVIAAL